MNQVLFYLGNVTYKTGGTFNEHVIIEWINRVLLPYKLANGFEELYLIYDSAKCHLTPLVKNHLENNKIILKLVKPGMTNLIQPADVILFAIFKTLFGNKWNDWFYTHQNQSHVMVLIKKFYKCLKII